MARRGNNKVKAQLQRLTASFIAAEPAHRSPLKPLLQELAHLGQAAYLFGGMLRDLMLRGLSQDPHDVDIVVAQFTPALLSFLAPHIRRKTRFGGLEVSIGHWDVDIWELSETWAFREGLVGCRGFEDLPKTTFLNLQAVAAEVPSSPGKKGRIVEHGFFQAIRQRRVDINFEDNPFPACCVLSALTTAYSLDFALAPKLIQYILHYGSKVDLEELCLYQAKRHGRCLYGRDVLQTWISHLTKIHRESPSIPITLPRHRVHQQRLPWDRRDMCATPSQPEAPWNDNRDAAEQRTPLANDCHQGMLF
jgi:hypothetical protein